MSKDSSDQLLVHEARSNWPEAMTLEELMRKLISEGNEKELIPILSMLPAEKKERYRRLWIELKGGKKND